MENERITEEMCTHGMSRETVAQAVWGGEETKRRGGGGGGEGERRAWWRVKLPTLGQVL